MAESFDAVVIGGGVIGASTLFHLTRLGCRALLLDRGELAGGATAQSSGIVRTHYSVAPNVAVARASLRMFQDFPALLDDDEADAGFADPYLVTSGFARAARRGGATVRTNTAVTGLLRDGDRVVGGETASGPVHAGVVLSAMNVWSQVAAGWAGIDIPLSISAHHVFTLAADRPYTPDLPVLKDLASPARLYMRASGGHLLVGGGHDGTPTDNPDAPELEADMDALVDEAAQAAARLPAFAEGRLVRSWSGLYDTTPDWNPVLGPLPGIPGLHVAFGFSGHGFKLSPMIGRMLAQSMLGQAPDLPLHPYRITRYAEGGPLIGAYGGGAVS